MIEAGTSSFFKYEGGEYENKGLRWRKCLMEENLLTSWRSRDSEIVRAKGNKRVVGESSERRTYFWAITKLEAKERKRELPGKETAW